MQKSKKSQNNQPAFNVVVIYGTVAVGKFTVANELYKIVNYKFFHNHHTHDLARQLFGRGEIYLSRLIENIRFLVFKEIAEAKINVVTTHTYDSDFVSGTGLTDPMYMKKIQSIIEKKNGRLCFVHLIADKKEILERVTGKSRKNYMKLTDKKTMEKILKERNWKAIAPVKNHLQVDNTKLSPKEVAQIIKNHFKL